MNKNIKKVATVILATNVLASTVLTTLPIGTHAAETPVSVASPIVNPIDATSTQITGKADPNATSIKVELHNLNQSVYATYEYTNINADGTFSISTHNLNLVAGKSVFISQIVNGVESPVTKTAVRYPKLQINETTVTTSTKSITVNNPSLYIVETLRIFDADGKLIFGINQIPMTEEALTFNLDLSSYAPGSYIEFAQGYVGTRPEYESLSIPTKIMIYDGSLDKSKSLVDALFIDNDTTKDIKPATTQADIDAAQEALNLVVSTIDKTAMQTAIDKANQGLANLELKQAAQTSVNSLFIDGDTSRGIKSDLTQANIDAAKVKVAALVNGADKDALQANIALAQKSLTEQIPKVAAESIKEFSVSSDGKVTLNLDKQQSSNFRYLLIDDYEATGFARLIADVRNNKDSLDRYTSIVDEDGLIKISTPAMIAPSHRVSVQVFSNGNLVFQKEITFKTDAQLVTEAQTAVSNLFVDGDTSKGIKSDLTQANIDAAQAKVDAITKATDKTAVQAELDKAITAFNYIAPTTIDTLSSNSTKVTGKGEPNAPVIIKNGTTTIGTGTVKADGTFEVAIAKQAANATITATVTKASNNKTATASTKVTQAFDYSLTTNPFKMGDTKVTGTVGKNVSKVRLWVNGVVAVQGVINADGTYEFPTAANFIKLVGDKVEVVAVDSKFVEVNRQDVAVSGTSTFDNALTVDKLNLGDKNITGKAGKDVSKVRLWVNDKVVTQATMNADGSYTFPNADKFITSPLDKVEVVAVDSQYKEINRKTVSVPGSDSYGNTFTADTYFIGQNTLSGSYGEGTSKVRLWVNGVVVKQADLDIANGTYTLKGIFGLIKNKTDKAEVVFVDAQYKEIKRIDVTVK
ncbi:hypothetical protein UE46_03120 [Listeria weihenstephanensis]|uniref:Uncharacterized protein n=3 Tax=Listeria weihenstephanensis TaxID=1006155 RepID=A0A1S7FRU1_9LIST|nr:immunoglobulin-like domain-containing protein [Listeria weihenstephanensis]AQY50123.1 hypothetical protein UE46_03120 [Listeria weihenstephanensis]